MEVKEQSAPGHFDFVTHPDEEQTRVLPKAPVADEKQFRADADRLVQSWEIISPKLERSCLPERLQALTARLNAVLKDARARAIGKKLTPQLELLRSRRMLESVLLANKTEQKDLAELPHVHIPRHGSLPRIANLAEAYLAIAGGIWSEASIALYMQQVQSHHPLLMDEIMQLPQALKFASLKYLLDHAEESADEHIPATLHSLMRLYQFEFSPLLESMIPFEATLRRDPTDTYAAMDAETRATYLRKIATLARHADFNESETACAALELARAAQVAGDTDPRRASRTAHIGYYLLAEGLPALQHRIGYHAPLSERLRGLLRRYNEDIYLTGIIVLSAALIIPIIAPLIPHHQHGFWLVMLTLLLALLPVTQGAVDLVNGFVQAILKTEALPKLDYSKGIPAEAATLVVVPTLLLSERQVQELFEDLEARYLSNEDRNLHFALLTDLPDSATQPPEDETQPLVQMAMQWVEGLNTKYAQGRGGGFLLLHRRRVFNHRQGVWMGWERKRGKLLDLNKLLLNLYDSFPIKTGPLHTLKDIRYVITLDSDTRLPHSAARRMVGTIHHPLNRALVSPKLGIVTTGYGLLQPRVGVSVASASRSRLAAIYSGETGLDIYTRAVSDVYQDLFGEGIFTGKGIYEVSILNQVLERRFPRNALLSHDLIEGAYVRAGLVTDVEVIDDYPSQYHAHTRRKHRWIRGDWQILRWLVSPVPDESGRLVTNPISLISRWKILDNLRRSLVEPITFLVLVFGWFILPGGAIYWTLVTLALLLLPATVQFGFDMLRALYNPSAVAARAAFETLSGSIAVALLQLTFLAHQMMLTLDAIARSLTRSLFSGRRLLEWETAAQAETSGTRTSLDIYLQLSPVLALLFAAALALTNHRALYAAGPVLFLWIIAPFAARWLNSSPGDDVGKFTKEEQTFLEEQALRMWRFYADFAGPDHHWLVPDHVEEKSLNPVLLLTPTNIGMLLNSRLAAYEFGFITLPEFTEATLGSLASYDRLEKHRGHVFNWYDLVTLRPIEPVVVSTVDSGNLAAALYTLRAAALDLLKRPMLNSKLYNPDPKLEEQAVRSAPGAAHEQWSREERQRRHNAVNTLVRTALPWLLPEFSSLQLKHIPTPEEAPGLIESMMQSLSDTNLENSLRARLPDALIRCVQLRDDLKHISDQAESFAEQMDFRFLFVESRMLLSNGFDAAGQHLHKPCFDLLASEARTAAFLAVAKGDIPQQSWFRFDRSHTLIKGRAVMLSWTATMFEYLMPTLWMRSYPDTLLTNSIDAVIQVQQDHVRRIPWGISESGYIGNELDGNYAYLAFGVPSIALKYKAEDGPVISPYSTFLALPHARKAAVANLRRMAAMGWVGEYGFYEAADYIEQTPQHPEPRLVRSWMAHHQGMAFVALTNALYDNIFQTWFHANPRVRAAEQLLHEKPLSKEMLRRVTTRDMA